MSNFLLNVPPNPNPGDVPDYICTIMAFSCKDNFRFLAYWDYCYEHWEFRYQELIAAYDSGFLEQQSFSRLHETPLNPNATHIWVSIMSRWTLGQLHLRALYKCQGVTSKALYFLRLVLGLVDICQGWSHVRNSLLPTVLTNTLSNFRVWITSPNPECRRHSKLENKCRGDPAFPK